MSDFHLITDMSLDLSFTHNLRAEAMTRKCLSDLLSNATAEVGMDDFWRHVL
jgi:hypothetical protein